ncbi:hypothetical protein SS50377_25473 [Spironucleus salmonicida]|uniref:Uncharacterized protein n=1 Tax=Spironucleus salmonicida TaxID=348837 RepID=V6LMT1_9EUKA|nr:hypothetical protein SS50377_25473 [Spironucleus salmonicida]|eukprot:EST45021.1 hypothetical protein SS50377_15040 [Spironucleus salmonicida]
MHPNIRLLPDDFASTSRALNNQMINLFRQDDEHLAIVKKTSNIKSLNTKIAEKEAEIYKFKHVYAETTESIQVLKDLTPIFEKLTDGQDQNILLFSTYNSVMGQKRKRIPDASPNQRVPEAVELAFCPHGPSIITKLLEYLTLQYNKIEQINIEFNIFETQKTERRNPLANKQYEPILLIDTSITTRNIIFNQPAHPDVILQEIMPKVVKYSVSTPSILKLKIVSTDQYQLCSKTAFFQIAIIPKICTDYKIQLTQGTNEFSFLQNGPIKGQMMYPSNSVELSKSRNQNVFEQLNKTMFRSTRSGISANGQTLAEKIKEQKCSCLQKSVNQQLLIKDVGKSAWVNADRKYAYQQYTKVIQYTNNQIFNQIKQVVAVLSSDRNGNPNLSNPFISELKSSFTGQVPLYMYQFCNITDSDSDSLRIVKMMSQSLKIAKVQNWKFQQKIEYVQIDKNELEFLRNTAQRASLIENDYNRLQLEYQDYNQLSVSQINLLRARGSSIEERGKLLEVQTQACKQRYLQKVQECLALQNELEYHNNLDGQLETEENEF